MGFSSKQVAALRRNVDQRHIRVRQSNGRELSYLEGWFVISEANRIFGFDGWSRETLESKCVLSRENRGYFTAVYTAKVRLTVQADGITIIREGHGTGEGRGEFLGEVHDTALKAAETDATKRALATFGRPFGLELYRGSQPAKQGQGPGDVRHAVPAQLAQSMRLGRSAQVPKAGPSVHSGSAAQTAATDAVDSRTSPAAAHESLSSSLPIQPAPELAPVAKFARDDTTPIPRPSTYYGRGHYHDIREENAGLVRKAARQANRASVSATERTRSPSACQRADAMDPDAASQTTSAAATTADGLATSGPLTTTSAAESRELTEQAAPEAPPLLPTQLPAGRIDKSALPLGEPKRIRDKEHLKFVARQPCLVCGRQPSDAHHLRFAQPRALGMKVSDEFTVPLCRTHHRNLHQTGNELSWWEKVRIEPLPIARKLWETSHPRVTSQPAVASNGAKASATETMATDETKPIAAVQS